MKKQRKAKIFLWCLVLLTVFFSGCGCGKKKEPDPKTQEVIRISITPAVTPTKTPSQVNPDAVVTKGGVTMVNEYLAGQTPAPSDQMQEDSDPSQEGGEDAGNTEAESGES